MIRPAPGAARRHAPRAAAVACFTAIAAAAVWDVRLGADDRIYDLALAHALPAPDSSREIAVVEIDDATLEELGERWPLSRATWARFLDRLAVHAPAAIAIDVMFDQPDRRADLELGDRVLDILDAADIPPDASARVRAAVADELRARDDDGRLSRALGDAGNVVLGAQLSADPSSAMPGLPSSQMSSTPLPSGARPRLAGRAVITSYPRLALSATTSGLMNVPLDHDGQVRRYAYVGAAEHRAFDSLALAAVAVAHPDRAGELRRAAIARDRGAALLPRFRQDHIAQLRFSDVLHDDADSPVVDEALRGRIVFVGASAPALGDRVLVPRHGVVPGVWIHATAADALLASTTRTTETGAWIGAALTLLILAGLAIATSRCRHMRWIGAMTSVAVIVYVLVAYLLAALADEVVVVVPAVLGCAAVGSIAIVERVIDLWRERRALSEQQRIADAKSEFVSVVTHELRTPLTSMRGSLGLLSAGVVGEIPEQAREFLTICENNTERLIRLVNDVLDQQKLDAGKLTFRFAPCDLSRLLDDALASIRPFADTEGVSLSVVRPDQLPVVADGDRLQQVLLNLLSNAIKYTPARSTVWVRAEARADAVYVSVRDEGPGIAPAFRARVFDKFSQARDSAGKHKGTGLGLSIARSIVEAHGGTIGFETESGGGSTFYFTVPASPNDAPVS